MAWGLGYFGMPQVLLRFMAIRKVGELRRSRTIAVTWCFLSLFTAVAIGLIGRAWAPALLTTGGSSETIFLHMAMSFFPPVIAGLVLSGILAASMSSADSYLLIASSSIANDLAGHLSRVFRKKDLTGHTVIILTRVIMLLVTAFGVAIALSGNDSIFKIVSYAWAGFGAAFGPLIIFSLFWKRTTLQGAIAGMVTGGAMVIIWKEVISKIGGAFAVYELLPAFILSCLVICVVSLLTSPPNEEIAKEFDTVTNWQE
jgi:sodium/proline symporter